MELELMTVAVAVTVVMLVTTIDWALSLKGVGQGKLQLEPMITALMLVVMMVTE